MGSKIISGVGVDAQKIQGRDVDPGPSAGDTLIFDGTKWTNAAGGGGGQGSVLLTSAATVGAGSISAQVYQDAPANTILVSFTSSATAIRLSLVAAYASARVTTTIGTYTAMLALAPGGGHYTGTVDVVVAAAGETITIAVLTPNGGAAASSTVAIAIDAPPQLTDCAFINGYPHIPWAPSYHQSQCKAGDTFDIWFVADKLCTGARVLNSDACVLQTFSFAPTLTGTITATIADRGTTPQTLPAWIQVCNAAGAYGSSRATNHAGGTTDGVDIVTLCNLYPSGTLGAPTYPGSQQALKNVETATVPCTAADYDLIDYTSPVGELSITLPTAFGNPKTVTRISGNYRVTGTNLRMTLRRDANGSQTVVDSLVQIAHVAISSFAVLLPAARLRSGGNDGTVAQDHIIHVQLDQQALAAPSLTPAANGGSFPGAWSGSGTDWFRTLRVTDNDNHTTHTWTAPSVTNLAGLVTAVISSGATYVIGGFVQRVVGPFAAFSQTATINVPVVTYAKLALGINNLNNHQMLVNPVQGNHSDIVDTATVDSIGTNPTTVWLNDVMLKNQNTLGLLTISYIEETV